MSESGSVGRRAIALIALPILLGAFAPPTGTGKSCGQLAALTLPDVKIVTATSTPAGPFAVPGAPATAAPLTLPAFCRVAAVATPTPTRRSTSKCGFRPATAWNGKFQGVGNGRFRGRHRLRGAWLRRCGAATRRRAPTRDIPAVICNSAKGIPRRSSTGRTGRFIVMTEAAKLIVRDHTGRFPDRSYFTGCATGGHQAMMEAQRFPADYDGIVAGNPAADRTTKSSTTCGTGCATHHGRREHRGAGEAAAHHQSGGGRLRCARRRDGRRHRRSAALHDSIRHRCCAAGLTDASCLTAPEAGRREKGLCRARRNPRTGTLIFPGWPLGSEGYGEGPGAGWRGSVLDLREPRRVDFFKYFVFNDPNWDWRTFDWDRDVAYTDARDGIPQRHVADLRAFQSRGGKLLMHTGWVDPILPAADVIHYYEQVREDDGRRGEDPGVLPLVHGARHGRTATADPGRMSSTRSRRSSNGWSTESPRIGSSPLESSEARPTVRVRCARTRKSPDGRARAARMTPPISCAAHRDAYRGTVSSAVRRDR